jgi:hypothetical protein
MRSASSSSPARPSLHSCRAGIPVLEHTSSLDKALKVLQVRSSRSRAALIYQHATVDADKAIADAVSDQLTAEQKGARKRAKPRKAVES